MACRKIDTSQTARKKEAIGYYRIESAIALFCALLINIFVVSVFARGFYGKASTASYLLLLLVTATALFRLWVRIHA